ncbi:hypothetical protein [Paenibacillus ihbetae]|uniref:Uncharacterized protein n=1 Tax=Paenibacillus ihbetae TaxID=1870820 RepID=A0A1B2DU95_9BACL|nr:hypothetical protein [Paenibacillus ihbetae]ANY71280.1 hypothetical protein BBD41_01020 [Paenibacillus ihbetae]OOC61358.1 hypothetical protein BBD40_05330 [Paenibacillus ihbetae]
MSKRSWYVFLTLCALIVISGMVYGAHQSKASFKELLLDHLKESEKVIEMNVGKNRFGPEEQVLKITDQDEIDRILNSFSEIKLRKSDSWNYDNDEYEIWLYTSNYRTFGIFFYSPDHIHIYNSTMRHKRYDWTYRITNDFDRSVLEGLFK